MVNLSILSLWFVVLVLGACSRAKPERAAVPAPPGPTLVVQTQVPAPALAALTPSEADDDDKEKTHRHLGEQNITQITEILLYEEEKLNRLNMTNRHYYEELLDTTEVLFEKWERLNATGEESNVFDKQSTTELLLLLERLKKLSVLSSAPSDVENSVGFEDNNNEDFDDDDSDENNEAGKQNLTEIVLAEEENTAPSDAEFHVEFDKNDNEFEDNNNDDFEDDELDEPDNTMGEPTLNGFLLTILPRIPACLSILGSAMIISSVARSEKNRQNMQQRIVGVMSCFDFMVSVVWFLTFLFIPREKFEKKGFPLALGNDASCDAQGFLIQLSTASLLYNVSLSFYYVFIIKYQWSSSKLASAEKYFHIFPISWGLITASVAVSMGLIGDADWDCWIEAEHNEYQWLFFFGPLFISLGITIINMAQVHHYVRNTERKSASSRQTREKSVVYKNTRQVAKQNLLYVLSFIVTWLLPSIARSIQAADKEVPGWLAVVCGTVIPSQGFFNAIVYFRLRFKRCGADYPDKPYWWLVYRIMILTLVPCCLNDNHNVHDGRDVEQRPLPSTRFNSDHPNSTN